MANRVRTTPEAVLSAIEGRIADVVFSGNANLVFPVLDDRRMVEPKDDLFATVRPWRWPMDLRSAAGGGNLSAFVDATVRVTLWHRLSLDQAWEDGSTLKDATYGLLRAWRLLFGALSMFDPADEDGNLILREPMRLTSPEFQPRTIQPGWSGLRNVYECHFWLELP